MATSPHLLSDLSGGVAVVTGAGSGIGEGIARSAAKRGMTVIVTDVATARAEEVARSIHEAGGSAEAVSVDVRQAAAVEDLAESVFSAYRDVRLIVNNAGVETAGYSWEMSPKQWATVQDVNLNGVFHGVRSFVPRMIERGTPGHVVNTASMASLSCGLSQQSAYNASKHAVLAFTECLHIEFEELGLALQAHVVCPGPVASRIFDAENAPSGNAAEAYATYADYVAEVGMSGREVGEIILRGVENGEFWVKTHPRMQEEFIRVRTEMLVTGAAPRPYVPGSVEAH